MNKYKMSKNNAGSDLNTQDSKKYAGIGCCLEQMKDR